MENTCLSAQMQREEPLGTLLSQWECRCLQVPIEEASWGQLEKGVECSGSDYPCSPNTLKGCKQGRPGTAEVILAGALPSTIFILAVWGWGF